MASTAVPVDAAPGTGRPRQVGAARAFFVVAMLGALIHGAFALAGGGGTLIDDWLYCGLYVLAAASCAARARRGDARGAWAIAAIGVLVWGAAEIVFRLSTSDPHDWYPRATQLLLFIGFGLAYTTLALLARERVRRFYVVLALDGLLAGLAAAAVAAVLFFPVLGPDRSHELAAPPEVFLVGALIGLVFVVSVLGLTGWRPGPAWALIATAIAINVIGDAVLVHLANAGRFHRGSVADTLFVTSALLLGLAAFFPSRHPSAPQNAARRLRIPLLSATVALAVLIAAVAHGAGGLAAGLAAAALATMVARMSIALDALERSRTQALVDDLTGLGNRRLLVRDLQRRLAPESGQRPFTLALFDLDGFKRYNDTFGHPSGDELLSRLAGRLNDAVSPGVAYRMGGDEFCAILDGEGPTVTNALSRAQQALSERGDAFSINSSTGAVACPDEAADVSGALAVADRRMYASKAGRALEQAQTRDTVLKMLRERDPALHDHVRAVAALALRVARRVGLDETISQHVARAAELHDIGKISVPDAILHKPGSLTAAEWQLLRQHPLVGDRILRATPSLAPLAPLVRSCHERWDGHGYPDCLSEAQTPIGARIIAACDAYHSMRATKPYRPARTVDAALAELERCAGTQFDPSVVQALQTELRASRSSGERPMPARRDAQAQRPDATLAPEPLGELRLSELLSGLSHALDLTEGQPRGHVERSCIIGMRLGAAIGLDAASRSSLFYALLLKDAGCSSNAAKVAALFDADDSVVKSSRRLTDTDSRPQAIQHMLRTVAPGRSPIVKAQHVGAMLRFGRDGARSLVELRCQRGAAVARAIGLGEATARAILELDEHWNGAGFPAGLARTDISIAGRILCLSQTAEVFWKHGGPSAACAIARKRRGKWFDPVLVDTLVSLEHDERFWLSLESPNVSELEPPDRVLVADEERLDRVAAAFASVVDAKSPYTARHSAGVAEIAVELGTILQLGSHDLATLHRAALLHDIGKLGVSNRILDKHEPLTDAEWAVMRSHPRWSEEILCRVRAFSGLAIIAGAHHERIDGSGYPNGLTAPELDLPSRILAVADVAEALGADRPYRPALSLDDVLGVTRREAGRKLDGDACAALEEALPGWTRHAAPATQQDQAPNRLQTSAF